MKTPKVIVKDKAGRYLLPGTDYAVKYESGRKRADRYGVIITFAGNYKGKVRKSFVIRPKTTSMIKAVSDGKGCILRWKKQKTETAGYQIEFATNKNFTDGMFVSVRNNNITSKSIKRVKAKVKNYVRIRTYKVVRISGERRRIYSEWSAPRTVIPKK